MKISVTSNFTGANLYTSQSAIIYSVDVKPHVGSYEDSLDPVFFSALFEKLPALQARIGELPGNWAQDRASLAHLFMHAAVELQTTVGCEIGPGKIRPTPSAGFYDVIFGYEDTAVGSAAGSLAATLIQHLLPEGESAEEDARPDFDFASTLERFTQSNQRRVMNLEQRYIVNAARARGIPAEHVGDGLVVFGQGRFQMRRLRHFSDHTSHLSFVLSSNKATTNRILGEIGLPVPEQQFVGSGNDAVETAEIIGYPVVIKPLDSDFGRGVTVGLRNAKSVRAAYKRARHYRRGVIVENFIPGSDHRMLIVNGELIAAANRIPAHITGDGARTVEELIEEVNRDPRRGAKGLKWLLRLEFDEEADRMLAEAGYSRQSVPGPEEIVYLRSVSNLSAGGTSIDVTDRVHPDNRRMAIWAAAAIAIDVAGIDFITPDISRSYKDVGGAICGVNTTPALSPHVAAEGPSRDIAGPIVDAMYPPGALSRIPVAVITGNTGRTATAQILAHILTQVGHVVGLSTNDGVFIGGELTGSNYVFGERKVRILFRNPTIDAAVLEISPSEILRHGLGIESCDVAAVINAAADESSVNREDITKARGAVLRLASDTTPIDDSVGPGELIEAMGVVITAASTTAVINADDELCLDLADRAEPDHVLLVTAIADNSSVEEHVRQGRRGAVLTHSGEGPAITIHDKVETNPARQIDILTGLAEDAANEQVQSVLFAASMAHCLGRTADEIRIAGRSFDFDTL